MIGLTRVGLAVGALGGLSGALYGLLVEQGRRARVAIGVLEHLAPSADGLFGSSRGGTPLRFAVLGDSMAVGVGALTFEDLPGVRLARALSEEAERPVRLETFAISGSTTLDLPGQVDKAMVEPPDVALIIIGANDVTSKVSFTYAASLLGEQVARLHEAGIGVVVGTCPDLGSVLPIAQPLRSVARGLSLRLARVQRMAVAHAGGVPVALADLLSPEFLARPGDYFSADRFHPSSTGYEAAAAVLLAPLCAVAGVWHGGPLPRRPSRSAAAEARRPTSRVVAWLNRR
ncbi:SGNH/GDSL hydrolase family protein [Lentzea tibetensis]|uniref:SGNH/GDSL hydrolase family protein n=1 Tax=Lentzea tibetensis TaxID=2591470 RepID=A0A563EN55_9PSEU|nr:SGNH/GDSL hydrolase family protein [Lentzea tibetensis]TWP48641.1 SGNH/GDSL hydrolase family protein [Lentzea tibetensis]